MSGPFIGEPASSSQDSLADGRLLIEQVKGSVDLMFGSSKEPSEKNLGWLTNSWLYDVSEDGGTVLFSDDTDIYLRRTDGSPAVRLGAAAAGSLSPDGRWVLASSESQHELSMIPTGPGQIRKISIGELGARQRRIHAGRQIDPLFGDGERTGRERLYVTDEAGKTPRVVSEAGELSDVGISPDGKEIALGR